MSVVSYNGITLPLANITQFSQESVYEDSNTDRTYTKFEISIQTLININYLSAMASYFDGFQAEPAQIMPFIRQELLRPRRDLSVKFNGNELIPQKQPGNIGSSDSKNGPIPKRCIITELTNTTFLLTYSIEAHYYDNLVRLPGGAATENRKSNNIVYNRWTETVDIDDRNYTTRTRIGKYAIRSENASRVTADAVRQQMCTLSLPLGFLRKSQQYSISPDGLTISYTIVDGEIYKNPEPPAFRAKATYNESISKMGANRYLGFDILLEGSRNTSQEALIAAAVIKASKVILLRGQQITGETFGLTGAILMGAQMQVGIYENTVRFVMTVMIPQKKQRINQITGFVAKIAGATLDANVLNIPVFRMRGTASLILDAANYYDQRSATATITEKATQVPPGDNPSIGLGLGGANWNTGIAVGKLGNVQEAG